MPRLASLPRPLSDRLRALSGDEYSTEPVRLAGCSGTVDPLPGRLLAVLAAVAPAAAAPPPVLSSTGSSQREARYLKGVVATHDSTRMCANTLVWS